MVRTFVLNLDLEPSKRWKALFHPSSPYKASLHKAAWIPFVVGSILGLVSYGAYWLSPYLYLGLAPAHLGLIWWVLYTILLATTFLFWFARIVSFLAWTFCPSLCYRDELRGLAEASGISPPLLLFMQFCYEWMSACTTAIVILEDHLVMFRTMDWKLPILKELTVEVEGRRDQKTVFRAVTWLGCLSIYTGVSCHPTDPFGIAMNCRKSPSPWIYFPRNLMNLLLGKRSTGYVIRETLEGGMSYTQAKAYLTRQGFISPSYMTIVSPRQASVFAFDAPLFRSRRLLAQRGIMIDALRLARQTICQTNYDWWVPDNKVSWWQNFTSSLERRDAAHRQPILFMTIDQVFESFDNPPIRKTDTIYSCVLDPTSFSPIRVCL